MAINIEVPKEDARRLIPFSDMVFSGATIYQVIGYNGIENCFAVWDNVIGENMIFFTKNHIEIMLGDTLREEENENIRFVESNFDLNISFVSRFIK